MIQRQAEKLKKLTKRDLISMVLEYTAKDSQVGVPSDAYKKLLEAITPKQIAEKEYFFVITLNGVHECLNVHMVTMGLVNRTIVHPREVFRPAMLDNASAVIVAHNHPSGSLKESPEDVAVTRRLKNAGELLGIPVRDHIIFCNAGYTSMLESGTF